MAYASFADVQAMYEQPLPAESEPRVTELLSAASTILDSHVPTLPARVQESSTVESLARIVVREAVMRALRNPSGAAQVTNTAGPFTQQLSSSLVGSSEASTIKFYDSEIELVSPPAKSKPVKSVRMGLPPWRRP